ncbi:hypothetical protein C8J56DRAFT_1001552 [Mycena floridula]|nr:hypothetical protein C8J56DRAFT_1001552 [Mycena floridula]
MTSSLSSVVSTLVRASIGPTMSSTVTDEDLDRHVKELLVKDAKKRAERYGQQGIRAYLSSSISDSNAPKANKRFLSSIIRSTDDHNKTILRAQAQAAEEIKRERREQERRDKRARAEEAVAAERDRLRRGVSDTESWDRWNGRTADRKRKPRDWESRDNDEEDEDRGESRRSRRHSSRRSRSPDDGSSSKRHKRARNRSPSASSSRGYSKDRHSRREDRSRRSRDEESSRHHHHRSRRSRRSKSRSEDVSAPEPAPEPKTQRPVTPPPPPSPPPPLPRAMSVVSTLSSGMDMSSRSPSPGPDPAVQPPSKMDKYFEESYDPRLDVAPLVTPKVPATGLINNAEFEGWDAMLELLRQRKEDKDEKRRLERMGYKKEEIKQAIAAGSLNSGVTDRWNEGGVNIMNIEYKKRGSVREWDLGKEGF